MRGSMRGSAGSVGRPSRNGLSFFVEQPEQRKSLRFKFSIIFAVLTLVCGSCSLWMYVESMESVSSMSFPSGTQFYLMTAAGICAYVSFQTFILGLTSSRADRGLQRQEFVNNCLTAGVKLPMKLRPGCGLDDLLKCDLKPTIMKHVLATLAVARIILTTVSITKRFLTRPTHDSSDFLDVARISIAFAEFVALVHLWLCVSRRCWSMRTIPDNVGELTELCGTNTDTSSASQSLASSLHCASYLLRLDTLQELGGFSVMKLLPRCQPKVFFKSLRASWVLYSNAYQSTRSIAVVRVVASIIGWAIMSAVAITGLYLKLQDTMRIINDSKGEPRSPMDLSRAEWWSFAALINQFAGITNNASIERQAVMMTLFAGHDRVVQLEEDMRMQFYFGLLCCRFFETFGLRGGAVMLLTFDATDLQKLLVIDEGSERNAGAIQSWKSEASSNDLEMMAVFTR